MKILVLTTQFPNCQEPTRGMFHLQIMRELQSLSDIRVVAPVQWPYPLNPYRIYKDVPEHEIRDGIETWHPRYMHVPRVGRAATGWLYGKSVWPTVRRLHKGSKFDVIIAYFVYPDGYAAVDIGRKLRIPVVVGALGTDINRLLFEGARKHLVKRTLRRADLLISVSSDLARKMESAGISSGSVRVITNGVDTNHFHWRHPVTVRQQLKLPEKRKIILYAGWLTESKGVLELLEAVRIIVQNALTGQNGHKDLLLALIGTGSLEQTIRDQIVKHNLRNHVLLAGSRPHEEVALWMNACDVFCLPSVMEGCPNVVLEARASGKPVVASNVGGIPDLIPNPHYGLLVPPYDAESLAKALQLALEREWQPEVILELSGKHTWRNVAEETYQCLESVVRLKQNGEIRRS